MTRFVIKENPWFDARQETWYQNVEDSADPNGNFVVTGTNGSDARIKAMRLAQARNLQTGE